MRLGQKTSLVPKFPKNKVKGNNWKPFSGYVFDPCESKKSIKNADNFSGFRGKPDFTTKFLEKIEFGQFFSYRFRPLPPAASKLIFFLNLINFTPQVTSSLYYNELH